MFTETHDMNNIPLLQSDLFLLLSYENTKHLKYCRRKIWKFSYKASRWHVFVNAWFVVVQLHKDSFDVKAFVLVSIPIYHSMPYVNWDKN